MRKLLSRELRDQLRVLAGVCFVSGRRRPSAAVRESRSFRSSALASPNCHLGKNSSCPWLFMSLVLGAVEETLGSKSEPLDL